MNFSFKLGKVVIPVAEEVTIQIEGLEFAVTDYDLKEGLTVAKAIPSIMREMKAVVEGEDSPSAVKGKVEEVEEEEMGFAGHPLFGGVKMVKVKKGQSPFTALDDILKDIQSKKAKQPSNPLEEFLSGAIDFGTFGKKLNKED